MKRYNVIIPLLVTALSLTGCGIQREVLEQVDPAEFQRGELSQTDTVSVQETESYMENLQELSDFDRITDEDVLARLEQGQNRDILRDYCAPEYTGAYSIFIPPETGDALAALQAESPNETLELLEEREEYALYSVQNAQVPVMLLKNFRMAGNGYAYFDGELTETAVLRNFDLITHDMKIIDRAFRDDPEIKCVSYDFYAVTEDASGGLTLGYYCYNIDREDHMFCVEVPDWNQMRSIETGQGTVPETETAETTMYEEELESWAQNMEQVDTAIKKLTGTVDYEQADADTRRFMIVNLLNDLGEAGMIVPESICESEDMVSFEYAGGGGGGVKLTPFDPMMN